MLITRHIHRYGKDILNIYNLSSYRLVKKKTSITLTSPGKYFFICICPDQCAAGESWPSTLPVLE